MSIACQTLYNDVVLELGLGSGNERLAAAFPRAVNRALDQLCTSADEATKFSHIEGVDATITELSAHYEYILYAGAVYYLIRMGFRPGDPKVASIVYDDTERRWRDGLADYKVDQDNVDQADEDNDIIGLGSLA